MVTKAYSQGKWDWLTSSDSYYLLYNEILCEILSIVLFKIYLYSCQVFVYVHFWANERYKLTNRDLVINTKKYISGNYHHKVIFCIIFNCLKVNAINISSFIGQHCFLSWCSLIWMFRRNFAHIAVDVVLRNSKFFSNNRANYDKTEQWWLK